MPIVLPPPASIGLFAVAALALLLIPGPAVLYIVSRSLEQGRFAGLVSNLGIHAGTMVHVVAASLGLSALLMTSALAFAAVKYLGAAYLIWLGLRRIFGPQAAPDTARGAVRRGYLQLVRDGFIVNLFNPKTALFFLAFLPQFADVGRGHVATQIAFLGLVFVALGLVTDSCYALVAGTAGDWIKRKRGPLRFERYVTGVVMIGLGVTAAFAGSGRK
ncbi:MAG TPA: LysE family translocator [Xanthobacteraceae bacterium]|jgi:threonine/homoserine/homoserine lactone efflux protein